MEARDGTVEQVLARLGFQTDGVVTRAELLAGGISDAEIRHRLRTGALLREYRGVYRVGHRAPCLEADYLAAVRACGPRAVLCGRAAAHLLGLLKGRAPAPSVLAPTKRRVPGVSTHRSRTIDPRDTTVWRGVPVTTVARTLVDLAAVLPPAGLARAVHEAQVVHRTEPEEVEAVLARRPTTPGAGKLRAILRGDTRVTLSAMERSFLALLRDHGLPLPVTNRPAGGRRVDCRWPEQRLTVELDGYRFHRTRHAWELDRRRERDARARGDDFRRYTYRDVVEDPRDLLRELRAALVGKRAAPLLP